MSSITVLAPAKINLALDVLRRRDDGYHDLRMIMQSVSLFDEMDITFAKDGVITLASDLKRMAKGDKNIAVRAARLFFETAGLDGWGCSIYLRKIIPVCGGMGGGSADAAAVLRTFQDYFGNPLTIDEMFDMAAKLGSDVPFCLMGGTALAEGRGEILTPMSHMPDCHILVCSPRVGISTAAAFKELKVSRIKYRPDWPGMLGALDKGDICGIAARSFNVFEDIVAPGRRDIQDIRAAIIRAGALGTVMSGTGPTMLGIFSDKNAADDAYGTLSSVHQQTFLVKPV